MKKCPKYLACPIFQKTIAASPNTLENYKNLFCLAGENSYSTCKRYIVAQKTGQAPPQFILPDTRLSVDEILELMKKND